MAYLLIGIKVYCGVRHVKVYTNRRRNIHARCKNGEIHKLCSASVDHALVGFPFSRFPDYRHHHISYETNDRKLHTHVMVLISHCQYVGYDMECHDTYTSQYKKLNGKALILSQANIAIHR
jgi:hypothetical protein